MKTNAAPCRLPWLQALPDGMGSDSSVTSLLHSVSGFSAPGSWGTIRSGCGAKMADVTTALWATRDTNGYVSTHQHLAFVTRRDVTDTSSVSFLPLIPSQKSLRSLRTEVNLLRSWYVLQMYT